MWRALSLILLLSACAAVPLIPEPDASRGEPADVAALRDCATITPRCAGMAALQASATGLCAKMLCFFTNSRETLAAEGLPGDEICGLRAVRASAQPHGIVGIWYIQRDGTRLYRQARFLTRAEVSRIRSKAAFRAACAAL